MDKKASKQRVPSDSDVHVIAWTEQDKLMTGIEAASIREW